MSHPLPAIVVGALIMAPIVPCLAINAPSEDRSTPIRPVPSPRSEIDRETQWERLLPKGERDHFSMIPPPPLHDYLSGDTAASQAGSAEVNRALEGVAIKLPGFIVPLAMTRDGLVSEFFLVPYVGACIHVPPPPPNQIVYIKLDRATALDVLYAAYWVTGTLHTQVKDSHLGAAAYSMHVNRVERYKS
jgi:uncharacterized protein